MNERLFILGCILLYFTLCCECVCIPILGSCDITNDSFHYYAATQTSTLLTINIESTLDVDELGTGDRILIIQTQGGSGFTIDSDPLSSNFGKITSYGTIGSYEFNFVSTINPECPNPTITLVTPLTNIYVVDEFSSFQVIKTVYCPTVNIISDLVCTPWDGTKGGIIAIEATTLNFNGNSINCQGAGFRGGQEQPTSCSVNSYPFGCSTNVAGSKGESFIKNPDYPYCRGSWASGGGGSPCNSTTITSSTAGWGAGGGGFFGKLFFKQILHFLNLFLIFILFYFYFYFYFF